MAKSEKSKVTTLTASIKDDSDTTIMTMSATVSSDPEVPTDFSQSIVNTNLYYTDIVGVRLEIDKFNTEKRKLEDAMLAERAE